MSVGDPVVENRIARAVLAGLRALVLLTREEGRALSVAEAVAERLGWPLHTWSVAGGVDRGGRERELGGLLTRLRETDADAIWLVFEAGRELRSGAQRRLLRELAQARDGPALILVEADPAWIPDIPELERERLPLPDHDQLRERLRWIAAELEHDRPALAATLDAALERIANAGVGLELERFDRVIAEAALADSPTPISIANALAARRLPDLDQPSLERIEPVPASELANFDAYLDWLKTRALSFDPAARQAGLSPARGVALVGAPGSGKRLAARVTASVLELNLLRLTPTALTSTETLQATLAAVERAAPVVLWIDCVGTLEPNEILTHWLASHERPVFVLITTIAPLPIALQAALRLDALFFIDLPTPEQRAQILEKLLSPTPPLGDPLSDFLELARAATDCTAADLAAALTQARLRSFAQARPLSAADFEAALALQTPTAQHNPDRLAALREWAHTHTRKVAGEAQPSSNTAIDST